VTKRNRTFAVLMVLLLAALVLTGCGAPQTGQDLTQPLTLSWQGLVDLVAKALILLNDALASIGVYYSWGWAIIVFTILIKVVTLPLTLKQLQSAKATQDLQPKLAELQQKYGKDRQKLSEEQMKLYKEAGVNPMGGCLPLLIQMPVLFALYQALYVLANPATIYPPGSTPLTGAGFYWIPSLTFPDLTTGTSWIATAFKEQNWYMLFAYFSLPVLMLVSQLLLQKMTQPATKPKPGQQDQTQMMGQMMMIMPIFFGYITLGLPAGLTLYWSVSNILSVVQQYFVSGWGGLTPWIVMLRGKREPATTAVKVSNVETLSEEASGPVTADGPKIKRRRRRK
jgi:YidC/Oxa1 family membrane protein insertase